MLLFRGSGKEWGELLAVIRELDRPVPSVLIELVIAEVTLNDEERTGIDWMFRSTLGDGRSLSGGTLGRLGLQDKAFSLTPRQRRPDSGDAQYLLRRRAGDDPLAGRAYW